VQIAAQLCSEVLQLLKFIACEPWLLLTGVLVLLFCCCAIGFAVEQTTQMPAAAGVVVLLLDLRQQPAPAGRHCCNALHGCCYVAL
jgi:hypothetical protein